MLPVNAQLPSRFESDACCPETHVPVAKIASYGRVGQGEVEWQIWKPWCLAISPYTILALLLLSWRTKLTRKLLPFLIP